ncbi:auxin-responsive protein IAA34 [Brassica rapa]|uniref:Auxin-responsive protein n=1 Tax=Brassica campestris TaxID=3711 RepID=M4EBK7_BRACM|nr:auxin-responsive protein IAA34 [Brassica rapa]
MECGSVIDLGLSLRTIQHEPYHTSGQSVGGYREVTDDLKSNRGEFLQKRHETRNGRCGKECGSNEGGRKKWGYVKVTMDGFVVGRKVCVLDHGGHSTLAHQLEDMFGMQSVTGLRLFERESEFSLVYKDKEGTWRNAEDVSWKELVENVERLRITRRNDFLLFF